MGAEARTASGIRKTSGWLRRGGEPLPSPWPSPSLLQVSETAGAADRGTTFTAMVAGPVTANDPDGLGPERRGVVLRGRGGGG